MKRNVLPLSLLGIGALCLPFTWFYTGNPVCAWIAITALLTAVTLAPSWKYLSAIWLLQTAAVFIRLYGALPLPVISAESVLYGILLTLPFAVHLTSDGRVPFGIRVLVFPVTLYCIESVLAVSPLASFGALGYSQRHNHALLQSASLFGVSGISFVIAVTASALSGLVRPSRTVRTTAACVCVCVIILHTWGAIREGAPAAEESSVRIAAVLPDLDLYGPVYGPRKILGMDLRPGTEDARRQAAMIFNANTDDILCRAGQACWKRIFSEWFPATSYIHANAPEFEVYPLQKKDRCDIWIPVKLND